MGSKKNRRAKITPVSRGQRIRLRKRLRQRTKGTGDLVFGSDLIRKKWDRSLSARQNFARLGLQYDANANSLPKPSTAQLQSGAAAALPAGYSNRAERARLRAEAKQQLQAGSDAKELARELEVLQNAPDAPPRLIQTMPLAEQRELMQLKSKYGDDFHAMQLDVKLNPKQKTPAQLKRRFVILERLQSL